MSECVMRISLTRARFHRPYIHNFFDISRGGVKRILFPPPMPRITPRCQDSGAYRLRCTPCSIPHHLSLTSPLPYPFEADRLRLTSGPCYPAAFPRPSMSIHSPLLTLCIRSTLQCLTPHLAVCPPDGPRLCANTMPYTHTHTLPVLGRELPKHQAHLPHSLSAS